MNLENVKKSFKGLRLLEAVIKNYKDFIEEVNKVIVERIQNESPMRKLFDVRVSEPVPVIKPIVNGHVIVLPRLGYIPQVFVEGVEDEIYVPIFDVDSNITWKLGYLTDSRFDIINRVIYRTSQDIINYETDAGLSIIKAAANQSCHIDMEDVDYFSKDVLVKIIDEFKKTGRTLTDLCITSESEADILEELYLEAYSRSEEEQSELFNISINGSKIYDVRMHVIDTIEDSKIYALDLSDKDALVMLVKNEYEAHPVVDFDNEQIGFSGKENIGMVCLDPNIVNAVTINK